MAVMGFVSDLCSGKEVPGSGMAEANGPSSIRSAAPRTHGGGVLSDTPQWPYSLQCSQQSQSWGSSQGTSLNSWL